MHNKIMSKQNCFLNIQNWYLFLSSYFMGEGGKEKERREKDEKVRT